MSNKVAKRCEKDVRSNMGKSEVSRHCVGVYPYENRNTGSLSYMGSFKFYVGLASGNWDRYTPNHTPSKICFSWICLSSSLASPVPFLCPHFRLV